MSRFPSLPLFYKDPVLLRFEEHADVGLAPAGDFSFARDAVAIPLCIGEFAVEFMKSGNPGAAVIERTNMFNVDAMMCGVSALALGTNAPTVLIALVATIVGAYARLR